MSDTTEILQTINTTIKKVMEQQATLMRMYDTVDQKFTRIEKQLEKPNQLFYLH